MQESGVEPERIFSNELLHQCFLTFSRKISTSRDSSKMRMTPTMLDNPYSLGHAASFSRKFGSTTGNRNRDRDSLKLKPHSELRFR